MNENELKEKREKEKQLVSTMIALYCRKNHKTPKGQLCSECADLDAYAAARVDHCPHMETKTFCSNCRTHCYKPEMREKIRSVMRWAGPRMLFHDPVVAIKHAVSVMKEKRKLKKENGPAA